MMAECILSTQQDASEQIGLRKAPLFRWNEADGTKGICPKGMWSKRNSLHPPSFSFSTNTISYLYFPENF
jgi:hypothetical protein